MLCVSVCICVYALVLITVKKYKLKSDRKKTQLNEIIYKKATIAAATTTTTIAITIIWYMYVYSYIRYSYIRTYILNKQVKCIHKKHVPFIIYVYLAIYGQAIKSKY